jgi:trimeric autotransporter adhesin
MVSVGTPTPGGGNSGQVEFTINATSNPAPTLTSLAPAQVNAGSAGIVLTLNGTNFMPASTIQWNGTALPTSYLSETQLEAQIPATSLAAAGFADISVTNPTPGGGVSALLRFTISYVPTVVNQLANDLIWDSTHQLIYLSVPSLALSNGNSISVLNPTTGAISSSGFIGSEPDALAISDDDSYLYVGMDGSSSVQRYMLPSLQFDTGYLLGSDSFLGPYFPWDLKVAPGLSHTTAVARAVWFPFDPLQQWDVDGGIAIYDDARERSIVANNPPPPYDSIQWASDTTIYANDAWTTGFDLYALTVSSSGVVQTNDYQNEFSELYMSIHYDSGTGFVYGDDGTVVNPANGQRIGSFQGNGLMIPDSSLNSAFFLGQTQSQLQSTNYTIEMFDLATFAPVAEITVSGVQGVPLHFIRWGANGLAFNDDAGFVYILASPFISADGTRPAMPYRFLSPVHHPKTGSIPKPLRASNIATRIRPRPGADGRKLTADSVTSNPVPSISALNPSTVALNAIGTSGFTLTVTGSNFISLSTIEWNGNPVQTEYVSSSELLAQIPQSDVASAGSVSVNVMTPSPGGGSTNSLPLTIVAELANPAPVIVSLSPNAVPAGSAEFTLEVDADFTTSGSVVEWNGTPLPTTNLGLLQVQVPASYVTTIGYAQITVVNPGPEGATSNVAGFQILYQPTVVKQVTNDMIWDPLNQVMYISVPSSASTHANQVCILNPATQAIGNCQTGNEPDVLAISGDSQFLYVGMDGTGSVQRYILPTLTPDISYSLGTYGYAAVPYFALDLQVAPGAPHTTAVTKGVPNIQPTAVGGITIFDDSTPRPVSTPIEGAPGGEIYDSLRWGSDATKLYASDMESTNAFFTLTVSSSGVVLDQAIANMFWWPAKIHYDNGSGLVYADDGSHAVNPSLAAPAGIFQVGGGWPMAPDSSLNTVFILTQYSFQGQESTNYSINSFDMTNYLPVAAVPFSTTGIFPLGRFIRWGSDGLAVNDKDGNIYLISGPFVNSSASKKHLTRPEIRH